MITIYNFLEKYKEDLSITSVEENDSLENQIITYNIQKTALGLTSGMQDTIYHSRIQIFGKMEYSYLVKNLDIIEEPIKSIFEEKNIPLVILTNSLEFPEIVKKLAIENKIVLMVTSLDTERFIDIITHILRDVFAKELTIHGSLIDVHGVGLLILGKSGIGKSETTLELIERGHRFVADDVIKVKYSGGDFVYGYSPEILKHHLEIRGIGLINIRALFGIVSVRERKKIEMVIELVDWDKNENYDRIGIRKHYYSLFHAKLPYLKLPLRQGRDIATIIEIAVRNQLAKLQGFDAAKEFNDKLLNQISKNKEDLERKK
jgi:HPr kinase/phosphorylase